jgi:fructose-specific phosphotransferase system IIC component
MKWALLFVASLGTIFCGRARLNSQIGDLLRSEALIGELVAIAETENGDWLVRFGDLDLGFIHRGTKSFIALSRADRPAIKR